MPLPFSVTLFVTCSHNGIAPCLVDTWAVPSLRSCNTALTPRSFSSGWVPNTSLQELSPDQASAAINDKMRKDLQSAYELASEGNGLDFYKDVLQQFQEDLVAKEEAQKAKKKKAAAAAADEMDIDAVDKTPAKKTKKRKAEDEVAVSVPPPPTMIPAQIRY